MICGYPYFWKHPYIYYKYIYIYIIHITYLQTCAINEAMDNYARKFFGVWNDQSIEVCKGSITFEPPNHYQMNNGSIWFGGSPATDLPTTNTKLARLVKHQLVWMKHSNATNEIFTVLESSSISSSAGLCSPAVWSFFFFGIFALCDSIAYLPVLFTILSACAPKLISIHWKDSVYQCLNCVPNIKKKQYLKLQSDGIVTGLTLRQSRAALFSTVLVFPHYIAAVQVPTSLIPACNEWSIRRSWEMASTAIDASFAEKPVIVHRSFTLEQWMPKSRFDTSYIYNTGYIMFVLFLPDWNPVPETSCEEQLQKPWSNQKISIVFSDSHSLAFVVLAPMKPLNQGREKTSQKLPMSSVLPSGNVASKCRYTAVQQKLPRWCDGQRSGVFTLWLAQKRSLVCL